MGQPWPIAIRDDSGVTRLEGEAVGTPNGGSFERIGPISVAFADPDFPTGIFVTVMSPGDVLLQYWAIVSVAFDVSTDLVPYANVQGGEAYGNNSNLNGAPLNSNSTTPAGVFISRVTVITDSAMPAVSTHNLVIAPGTPGADTAGSAEFFCIVLRAP